MEILEVFSAQHHKAFIKFPHQLYKNDAEWVAPLNQDIEEVFDPKQNPFYKNGEVCRWLLFGNDGKII